MRKAIADIGSGIGFLAIAAVFFVQHEDGYGVSYVFPLLLMGVISLGGVYYLIKGLFEYVRERQAEKKAQAGTSAMEQQEARPAGEHWGNIIWVSAMAIAYAVAIPLVGYWISTGLFLFITYIGLVRRSGNIPRSLINAAIFGGGFSLLVWVGFVKLMSVPTPEGALW